MVHFNPQSQKLTNQTIRNSNTSNNLTVQVSIYTKQTNNRQQLIRQGWVQIKKIGNVNENGVFFGVLSEEEDLLEIILMAR